MMLRYKSAMGPSLNSSEIHNLFWMNERQNLGFQHFLHRKRVEYPLRLQDEYVIVYCMHGQIKVTESSRLHVLEEGDLLVGNSLRWRTSEYATNGPCEGLSLIVSPKLLGDGDKVLPEFEGTRPARHLRRLVEESIQELASNQSGKHELLDALGREFLVRALRLWPSGSRQRPSLRQRLLSRRHFVGALDFMQSCGKSEFSLDRLSHRIGLAPADFSRLFRASTGQTPLRVYNNLLISQAEEALVHADSIKEVVYKLGFQSPSHFTALYRKVKGRAPSESRLSKS